MGQGQSSSNDAPAQEPAVKQDYYELLDVERTATEDELKKAYRRKALELHPDRNYGKEEDATRLFAEIRAAYEILSDPQERAWYDSHRDVLLRGEVPGGAAGEDYSYNMKLTATEDVLKLVMRFNKNVEYSDAPSGFFGGLNDFFKQIAKEEDVACQWQDLDYLDYPEFGSKEDDYEDIVRPFYGAWTGFTTKKSYSWKDQYRLSDAPDRRIRRLMEKENQKLRDEAIADYNDAVRSLVAFVRKRDTRVQNNLKSEAERQKILKDLAAAQAARMKAKRQLEIEKQEQSGISSWAHTTAKDEHEGGFSSESDIEEHEFECVVCDKTFKSERQFQAHEKSKKHIKLLKELKREMRKEGKDLDLQAKDANVQQVDQDEEETLANQDEVMTEKHTDSVPQSQNESDSEADAGAAPTPIKTNGVAEHTPSEGSDNDSDDDYAPRKTIANRLTGVHVESFTASAADLNLSDTPAASGTDTPSSRPKLGKAKQKRAKKAGQKAVTDTASVSEFACAVCKAQFPSKTKLFDHIKTQGHAALKTDLKAGSSKSGKTNKKK